MMEVMTVVKCANIGGASTPELSRLSQTSKVDLTWDEAWNIVGGLSEPGILPGYAWSISREHCKRGRGLRDVSGSVCSLCYAAGGNYRCPLPVAALERRYERMHSQRWVEAMIRLLQDEELFRWFDCGDLQSVRHLERIVAVCEGTPKCKHWLATRERETVREFLRTGIIPANLNIRISADWIDDPLRRSPIEGCTLATVTSKGYMPDAHNCPLSFAGSDVRGCADVSCFACWDKSIHHVNYLQH